MTFHKLIIAEKPSVAVELAKAVGATKRESGFISGSGYYVTWCVGHLIETAMPEDYCEEHKKWSIDPLPIIPDPWRYKVSSRTKLQYQTVKELINRPDVDELICATDSGREGELIFRLVYNQTGSKKPFKRLWISSMEESAIKEGLSKMKDGREYDKLYCSALSRLQADWLVGINVSRLFSCLYNKTLNIGRVQTPTINLIVERQKEIDNFKPQPYYILSADCGGFIAARRVDQEPEAKKLLELCNGKNAVVSSITKKPCKENPAALYDLTTLQREANKLLGLSAQQTLDAAQSLYEKKLITYPRTDSRYLTEDMTDSTKNVMQKTLKLDFINPKTHEHYDISKADISSLVNNKKVTDHHAIIPTGSIDKIPDLSLNEKNILLLITYKLLVAAYIPHEYTKTDITITIESTEFTASGRQITCRGFKGIQDHLTELLKIKDHEDENKKDPNHYNSDSIPELSQGDIIPDVPVASNKKMTSPPKPYTEDTLLSAMENALRAIDDEDLKKDVAGIGLGTPATRAGIIERIIKTGFIERKKKNLLPTPAAFSLIDVVPDKIKSPCLTAEWEQKLEHINQGSLSYTDFYTGIAEFVKSLTDEYKGKESDSEKFREEKEVIGRCPRCGKNIYEGKSNYYCESGKECNFSLWKEDKFFTSKKKSLSKKIAKEILKNGRAKVTGLFSEKTGKAYDAYVSIEDTGTYINYKIEFISNKIRS
ncbi:MAG: DNA topoisomerase 3 [Clostridiaceae bacterium]|nr:DNA topoisomerase 3 [Clostridiaceae bacterium]